MSYFPPPSALPTDASADAAGRFGVVDPTTGKAIYDHEHEREQHQMPSPFTIAQRQPQDMDSSNNNNSSSKPSLVVSKLVIGDGAGEHSNISINNPGSINGWQKRTPGSGRAGGAGGRSMPQLSPMTFTKRHDPSRPPYFAASPNANASADVDGRAGEMDMLGSSDECGGGGEGGMSTGEETIELGVLSSVAAAVTGKRIGAVGLGSQELQEHEKRKSEFLRHNVKAGAGGRDSSGFDDRTRSTPVPVANAEGFSAGATGGGGGIVAREAGRIMARRAAMDATAGQRTSTDRETSPITVPKEEGKG